MNTNLSILVVSWNRLEYLKRTMSSLLESVNWTPENKELQILLVDNASTEEGYSAYLEELGQMGIWVITNSENVGWGAAVNQGLEHAKYDWILLSNGDTTYDSGWLGRCLEAYKDNPSLGVLGLWHHTAHGEISKGNGIIIKNDMPAVAWLLKRDTISFIGPISEKGAAFGQKGGNGEDSDYCRRAIEKGYLVAGLANPDGTWQDVSHHITGY